jgi:hypothetical protein
MAIYPFQREMTGGGSSLGSTVAVASRDSHDNIAFRWLDPTGRLKLFRPEAQTPHAQTIHAEIDVTMTLPPCKIRISLPKGESRP